MNEYRINAAPLALNQKFTFECNGNIFASQISLPDDEILEYIEMGYDIQQIAIAKCLNPSSVE